MSCSERSHHLLCPLSQPIGPHEGNQPRCPLIGRRGAAQV